MIKDAQIFFLNQLAEIFDADHMDTEAKLLRTTIYDIGILDEIKKERDAAIQALKDHIADSGRTCIDQIRWERDTAIAQLAELGYGFGEKIRTDGDCISRQATLDWLNDDWDGMVVSVFDGIRALPSAHPDLQPTCNQVATDCISRKAAIDAMRDAFQRAPNKAIRAMHIIRELPSVQPELPPYVTEIEAEFKKWGKVPYITKPFAKALYEIWKKHDGEDAERGRAMMKWEAETKGYTCNDCFLSMQNCHDMSICCEDETGLCDWFEEMPKGEQHDS